MKRQRGNHKITAFFAPPSKRAVPDGATSVSTDRGTTHDGPTCTSGDLATDTRDGATGASADSSTTEPIADSVPHPRGRRTDDSSKHRIGYDREWEHNHPWVFYVQGEGMYCKYCRKFDTKNRQNQSKVWNLEACTTLRRDVLARHEASTMHKEALEQERACQIVKARGGIREAMQGQVVLQRKAIVGAMKCLYWLCKLEIPHTTNYKPLLSLAMNLGCSYMSALNVAGNAQYTSEHIVQELVGILAQQIEHAQLQVLSNSRFYGLIIDESTDISVLKQLVLNGRYVSEAGQPCSTFLRIVDLVDGTAERIEEAIKAYLAEKGLPFSKLMGFGSDGASVMTGRVSDVATRLHKSNQYLVAVHCVAHRLALACSQAGQNVPYVQKFKKSLTTLFWFFKASAVRTAGLKAIQELLDSPTLKLKEAKDVRWLSHDQAVQTLRRTLPAVLVALELEGTEKGEPVALGLVKVMKNYQFVACLNLMCEVLPHISHLSRLFQAQYAQLTMIKPSLDACSKTLESYKEMVRTPDIAATELALANQLQQFSIQASPAQKETFNKNVRQPFLQLLLQNLSDRFPQVELLSAFSVFDPILLCSCNEGERESLSLEKLEILLSYYGAGDDAPVNREEVFKEWESFSVMLADHYTTVKTEEVLHDLASEKLKDVYPQLACLASLGLTIPFSTADCERAFSSMKRVKTPLRNRLKTSTLDSLLRFSIEGPDLEDFNFDQALSTWTSIRNRRISV